MRPSPEPASRPTPNASSATLISVGILTRNGGAGFQAVIDALHGQTIDVPVEIVILDSGSTDGTLTYAEAHGVVIHRIPPESFSFGESRDLLFSRCRGDIIATLSQDALPVGTDWLDVLTRPIRDGQADIVQGLEDHGTKSFYWERIGKFYFSSEWAPFFRQYGAMGLSTVNLATSRTAWEQTGFGPIPMCSDKLFQKRTAQAGLRVAFRPQAVVQHGHTYTTARLFKRCANEGMALRHLGFELNGRTSVRDLFRGRIYRTLVKGLVRGEIRSMAEVLFPLIRPVAVWYGNRYVTDYWR